jgi:hypothetical protein
VISDDPVEVPVPVWPRSDIAALGDLVLQQLSSTKQSEE